MKLVGQYMPLNEGYHLHVVTSGSESSPPLLMLHCWTGNWVQWESTMRLLDGKFRFIVPDQLGHGNSDKPVGDHYQIDAQVDRIRQIILDLGYERVSIIGHSMGGMLGLSFAGMFPDMVDKLIVLNPAVTGKVHPHAESLTHLVLLGRRGIVFPLQLYIFFGKLFPEWGLNAMKLFLADPHQHPEAAAYWGCQGISNGQTYTTSWTLKAILDWDTRPFLPNITARTLAIWGEEDYIVPIEQCDVLAENIKDFQALRLPNIGHFTIDESWDDYSRAIINFLGSE